MKRIVPAIVAASLGVSLVAQSTGTLQGKVVDSKGKPIPGAKVVISRVEISWAKELQPNAEGKFIQVGFAPADYKFAVSAQGFVDLMEEGRIGLGVTQKEFVLLTPEEAVKSGKGIVAEDPSVSAEKAGLGSFNQAVGFYNDKNYSAALPLFEAAIRNLNESMTKATNDTAKVEIEQKIQTVQRPYAFAMVEVGKSDAALRVELFNKAEPILVKTLGLNPKDQNALVNLLEIATTRKDAEGAQKYQKALDAILGPRPELAYNQGVELYNLGKLAEAKPFFLKSLSVKADFADAYYLLAMCEFSENNLKGTKANLQKYIDLSPAGKHAAEVKAMLADPSLKNIK